MPFNRLHHEPRKRFGREEGSAMKWVVPGFAGALIYLGSLTVPFNYDPPGKLVTGSGRGFVDTRNYAPGMRFPIESAPAYANSQVWGHGGSNASGGSQCDGVNYSYPWHDNYCETRTWPISLCPAGTGHQGQD